MSKQNHRVSIPEERKEETLANLRKWNQGAVIRGIDKDYVVNGFKMEKEEKNLAFNEFDANRIMIEFTDNDSCTRDALFPIDSTDEAIELRVARNADDDTCIILLNDTPWCLLANEKSNLTNSKANVDCAVLINPNHQNGIDSLKSIRNMRLFDTRVENLDILAKLANIEVLDLEGCSSLATLSGLENLATIRRLDLMNCESLKDISTLANLKNLEFLRITDCEIDDISVIGELTELKTLRLAFCAALHDITPLRNLRELQFLSILANDHITDLSPLSEATKLEALHLGCENIEDLSPLSKLENLESLAIVSGKLTDITPLSDLSNLRELDLNACHSLSDFSPLAKLSNLKALSAYACAENSDFDCLTHLTELEISH